MADDQPINIPTDLKVPQILTKPPQGEIPVATRVKHSTATIDKALVEATNTEGKTDRQAAADKLGMHKESLSKRINNEPQLKLRWGREKSVQMLRESIKTLASGKEDYDPVVLMHRAVDIQLQAVGAISSSVIKQIKELESKIAKHEAAVEVLKALDPDKPENKDALRAARYDCFRCNLKGDPEEEKLARETLTKLYEEYRKGLETGINGIYTKARISSAIKSVGAGGGHGGKRKGLGIAPKGSRPVGTQMPQTLIDARGANVLVTNGGTTRAETRTEEPGAVGEGGAGDNAAGN